MSRRRSPVYLSPISGKLCDETQRRKEIVRKRAIDEIERMERMEKLDRADKANKVIAAAVPKIKLLNPKHIVHYKPSKAMPSLTFLMQNLTIKQALLQKHAEMKLVVEKNLAAAAMVPKYNPRLIDGKPKQVVLPVADVFFDSQTGRMFTSKKNSNCRSLRESVMQAVEGAKPVAPPIKVVCDEILTVCDRIEQMPPVAPSAAIEPTAATMLSADSVVSSVVATNDNIAETASEFCTPGEPMGDIATAGEFVTPGEFITPSETPGEPMDETAGEPITPGEPVVEPAVELSSAVSAADDCSANVDVSEP